MKFYARAYDDAVAIKQGYVVDSAEKVFLQDDNTCITLLEEAKVNEVLVDSISEILLPVELKLNSGKALSVWCDKQDGYPQISLVPVKTISNMLKVNLKPMYEGNDHIKSVLPATFESPYIYIEIKK